MADLSHTYEAVRTGSLGKGLLCVVSWLPLRPGGMRAGERWRHSLSKPPGLGSERWHRPSLWGLGRLKRVEEETPVSSGGCGEGEPSVVWLDGAVFINGVLLPSR